MSEEKDYRWENLNERIAKLENNGIPGVRDFFATSALSVLAAKGMLQPHIVAEYCYSVADAMIKEREKRNE